MRTNKLLSLIIVLGMGFSACYDENDIHTTKGDIPYELKEGGDAVDQYIYKFYRENGSIIMVDYDTIDYQWTSKKCLSDKTRRPSSFDEGIFYVRKDIFKYL